MGDLLLRVRRRRGRRVWWWWWWAGVAIALVILAMAASHAAAKPAGPATAAKRFSEKRLQELEAEDEDEHEHEGRGGKVRSAMIFAELRPGLSQEAKDVLVHRWQTLLRSASISVRVFETGPNTWCFTTEKETDNAKVVEFLHSDNTDECMRTTLDGRDIWKLPKYEAEFRTERDMRQKEQKQEL